MTRPGASDTGRGRRLRVGRLVVPFAFLLPTLAVVVTFRLVPLVEAFRLSFTSWDGLHPPKWVGLANFERLLGDERFWLALSHNLLIFAALPIVIVGPFIIATVLHDGIFGWRFFRFAYFLPTVLSPVVVGIYYGIVLADSGPVNSVLDGLGLGFLSHSWLNDPSAAFPVVIAVLFWAGFGVGVLIFMAGLGRVDQDVVAAARVDGAGWWAMQKYVIIPAMLPVIEFWTALVVISGFTSIFPLVYSLTAGGPGNATTVLDYYIYQQGFGAAKFGFASAIGIVLLMIVGVLLLAQLWVVRRGRSE